MSVSKVVKSKQCYLHPKTNTDNMHICLNFIFKKEHTINGSNILWIGSFTEDKIVLTKWPEMASHAFLVFKIFWGRTPIPPFQITKYVIYRKKCELFCQLNTAHTQSLVVVILFWYVINGLHIYWLNGLLHPFHTFIYQICNMGLKDRDPIKILENFMLICSLFLLEFQWNNLYFA